MSKRKPTPSEWSASSEEMIDLRFSRGHCYMICAGLRLLAKGMKKEGKTEHAKLVRGVEWQINKLTGCNELHDKPEDTHE